MIGKKSPVRQQPHTGAGDIWPADRLEVDPFALPVRYELPGRTVLERALGTRWAVTLYRDHIVFWRDARFSHVPARVLPLEEFDGVVATAGPAGRFGRRVAINLVSVRHGLGIPLYVAGHADDAAARWDAWGRSLGLSARVVLADGSLRDPVGMLGSVLCCAPMPRRSRSRRATRRFRTAWSACLPDTYDRGQPKDL